MTRERTLTLKDELSCRWNLIISGWKIPWFIEKFFINNFFSWFSFFSLWCDFFLIVCSLCHHSPAIKLSGGDHHYVCSLFHRNNANRREFHQSKKNCFQPLKCENEMHIVHVFPLIIAQAENEIKFSSEIFPTSHFALCTPIRHQKQFGRHQSVCEMLVNIFFFGKMKSIFDCVEQHGAPSCSLRYRHKWRKRFCHVSYRMQSS